MPTHRRPLIALRLTSSGSRGRPSVSDGSNSPDAADSTAIYLSDLLADTREELTRVDAKAALLLAASGVIIGAVTAGLVGGKWTPFQLDSKIEWLWWAGVALAAFGVSFIGAAVDPRIRRRGGVRPALPAYYGDVAEFENVDAFRRAIERAPGSKERLIDQTFLLSRIVRRKYILLRRGLRALLLAILACIAAVMINIPLSR